MHAERVGTQGSLDLSGLKRNSESLDRTLCSAPCCFCDLEGCITVGEMDDTGVLPGKDATPFQLLRDVCDVWITALGTEKMQPG
ncbi:MAG TPA: hypothetical protein DEF45_21855 [Rhodopirellula sp.]|nr:hypothetical protein [Rhodopirellula sp.]